MSNINHLVNKSIKIDANSLNGLLTHLFADTNTVYIDDINFKLNGGYDVSYCRDYTLKMGSPQWLDISIDRQPLINLILQEELNHWESFQYDQITGMLQPYSNKFTDIESFLDENYKEVIKIYLERKNGCN